MNSLSNSFVISISFFAKGYIILISSFVSSILADNIEITGIAKSKNRNVVIVTKREWELNPQIEHNMYVVENLAIDGIIIWQNELGSIYESAPGHKARKTADSLADYLLSQK